MVRKKAEKVVNFRFWKKKEAEKEYSEFPDFLCRKQRNIAVVRGKIKTETENDRKHGSHEQRNIVRRIKHGNMFKTERGVGKGRRNGKNRTKAHFLRTFES